MKYTKVAGQMIWLEDSLKYSLQEKHLPGRSCRLGGWQCRTSLRKKLGIHFCPRDDESRHILVFSKQSYPYSSFSKKFSAHFISQTLTIENRWESEQLGSVVCCLDDSHFEFAVKQNLLTCGLHSSARKAWWAIFLNLNLCLCADHRRNFYESRWKTYWGI